MAKMKKIIRLIKDRWEHEDEPAKIFSKEWFLFLLVLGGGLAFLGFLALIFGDKVEEVIGILVSSGFCFGVGVVYGLQKGKRGD